MMNLNTVHPHAGTPERTGRQSFSEPQPSRQPRIQLVSEAVVAGYIHDISERAHGAGVGADDAKGATPDSIAA